MKLKALIITALISLNLTGCKTTEQQSQAPVRVSNVPLGVPLLANYRNEIAIARYSEMLSSSEAKPEEQAELLYKRGMLYDSVGLSTLARIDFNRSVKLRPSFAGVYNFLGIHHTLSQEYSQAYDMFATVLELDEEHEYAYLNRGIASYYSGRFENSSQDLNQFLSYSPNDAYRVMWVFLADMKIDPVQARAKLAKNSQALDQNEWSTQLAQLYLGEISQQQFLGQIREGVKDHTQYAQRLCEAYFYLAKLYQAKGKPQVAVDFFKLALSTNVYEFVEHKYARLELEILAGAQAG